MTDHRAWHFGGWSRERTWATGLYKSACGSTRRGGPASSQHCALEKERGIGTWGAGLTPDGRTGEAPGLSPRPHAPCRGVSFLGYGAVPGCGSPVRAGLANKALQQTSGGPFLSEARASRARLN